MDCASELGSIFRNWLIDAVRNERRKKDPLLFQRSDAVNLSGEALISEMQRLVGWAVRSCRDKVSPDDHNSQYYQLLKSMVCYEKDVDDDYVRTKLDLGTIIRNVGGEGGLSLVADPFVEWGKKATLLVAKELTVDDISMKGDIAMKSAKKNILEHASLKSDFVLACKRQYDLDLQLKVCKTAEGASNAIGGDAS